MSRNNAAEMYSRLLGDKHMQSADMWCKLGHSWLAAQRPRQALTAYQRGLNSYKKMLDAYDILLADVHAWLGKT